MDIIDAKLEAPRTSAEWFFPIGRYKGGIVWCAIGMPSQDRITAEGSCQHWTGLAEIKLLRVVLPMISMEE